MQTSERKEESSILMVASQGPSFGWHSLLYMTSSLLHWTLIRQGPSRPDPLNSFYRVIMVRMVNISFILLFLFFTRPYWSLPLDAGEDVAEFTINLTWEDADLIGVGPRKVIYVNGSIPGPPLYIDTGRKVKFLVNNFLLNETAVHFHGIGQRRTPWADGTPGITQYSIEPGASYIYEWYADEPGIYFYHAHNRGQIMDGLYGAIVIAAPEADPRPFDLISSEPADQHAMLNAEENIQPLFISDWSQFTSEEFNSIQTEAHIDYTCVDSIITNGVGSQYCLARDELEGLMTPLFRDLLRIVGNPQLSDKGCVPPVPGIQGDFDFNFKELPPTAYSDCRAGTGSAANYTVNVKKEDGWAAMTLINPAGLLSLKVTIDNHPLHIYAVDGHYIVPQTVDLVVVNPGDRISFFIKLDQPIGQYTLRISNSGLGQFLSGFAVLNYKGATAPAPDTTPLIDYAGNPLPNATITTFSDLAAAPFPTSASIRPAPTADATYRFLTRKLGRPHDAYEWTLSGTQRYYRDNRTSDDTSPTPPPPPPILFRDPALFPPSELLVKTSPSLHTWIDLIILIQGPYAQPHPLHKHGNKFFVLGSGVGPFPYPTVADAAAALPPGTFNFESPPYRDTWATPPGFNSDAWAVLRYRVENPGAWLMHCHVQTHFGGGMAVVLLDGWEEWMDGPGMGMGKGGKEAGAGRADVEVEDWRWDWEGEGEGDGGPRQQEALQHGDLRL